MKNAIVEAMGQSREEAHRRIRPLRRQVLTHDVNRWARLFLDVLRGPDAALQTAGSDGL